MDELMISGRRYLSSLRAAKENGYHSDYIGQLIRGNKVKGQKVGRAWYVDAESLAEYLGKEKTASAEPAPQKSSDRLSEPSGSAGQTFVPQVLPSEIEKPKQQPHEKSLAQASSPIMTVEARTPEDFSKEAAVEAPEEDPEEYRVVITKVEDTPEPTIKISIPREEERRGGLTYISDEEPLLPEIRKGRSASRQTEASKKETFKKQKAKVEVEEERPARRSYAGGALFLTALGVIALVLVGAASTLFVQEISVGTTETASVKFSLPN